MQGQWVCNHPAPSQLYPQKQRLTSASCAARPPPPSRVDAPPPRPARRAAVGTLLDPRLAEPSQVIKVEHSTTPGPTLQSVDRVLRHRNAFAPHMHYWPTESRASSLSYTNPEETSSEYSDPGDRRRYHCTAAADTCAVEDEPVDADPMAVSESTKLKGVYWPGMDIFDSATPEMRRKRNQKKDSSVVEQLELNSQEVEATELIFTPQGSFKRLRRISCSESDDEEEAAIKHESPQSMRMRPALAGLDGNIARRAKQHNRPPVFPYLTRSHYEEDHGLSVYEYGYGHGQDHGDRGMKRRRFDVFQDQPSTFSQPASMNYLTSGFTHQPTLSPAPVFASYKPLNDPFQFENKESMHPSFTHPTYANFHNHNSSGYQYNVSAYGLGPEPGSQYMSHLFNMNHVYEPQDDDANGDDDDDQRTITAPPSPSTT